MGKYKHLIFIAPLIFVAALMVFAYRDALFSTPNSQSIKVEQGDAKGPFLEFPEVIKNHKKTLVALWATWCGPCVKELPVLDGLTNELNSKGIGFLMINYDPLETNAEETKKRVQKWMMDLRLKNLKTEFDFDSKILNQYKVHSLPFAMLVNQDQKIESTFLGEQDWVAWVRAQ